ncbi:hypothetical protein IAR55_002465 [Kwoniella newhampshirensis]|uniref:Uncharacterized protein n=1 Tax=Kwoniella newhampshirensis TaxID=1651941 RepID=A0AAW0YUA7_9TREE
MSKARDSGHIPWSGPQPRAARDITDTIPLKALTDKLATFDDELEVVHLRLWSDVGPAGPLELIEGFTGTRDVMAEDDLATYASRRLLYYAQFVRLAESAGSEWEDAQARG